MNEAAEIGRLITDYQKTNRHVICLQSALSRIGDQLEDLSQALLTSPSPITADNDGLHFKVYSYSTEDTFIGYDILQEVKDLLPQALEARKTREQLAKRLSSLGVNLAEFSDQAE